MFRRIVSALAFVVGALAIAQPAMARRITTVLTSAGDGVTPFPGNSSRIDLDAAGNLYVLSSTFDTVFKITPAGVVSAVIDGAGDGMGNPFECGFFHCRMLVTAAGDVYVSGAQSDNVLHADPGGTVSAVLDASGDGLGNTLDFAGEMVMDTAGNLYVAGGASSNVFKVAPGGAVTEIIDSSGDGMGHTLSGAGAMAVDAADNVFVEGAQNIFKITPGGVISQVLGSAGDGLGHTFVSRGIAPTFDGAGNLYVTSDNDNVFKVTPGGTITVVIDATGDGMGNALDEPLNVALDATGNIYVSSVFSGLFRVAPGGTITFLGSVGSLPSWVYTDPAGTVYAQQGTTLFRIAGARLQTILDIEADGMQEGVTSYVPGAIVGDGAAVYVEAATFDGFSSPASILRLEPLCDATPRSGCHAPTVAGAAKLLVKDLAEDGRDLVSWRWVKGAATDAAEFGDPGSLDYSLCFYESATAYPIFEASAPAGGPCVTCWAPRGSGFQYRDRGFRAPDGVFKMLLTPGSAGAAKAIVKAKGENVVDDLTLPATLPLTVQLQASNGSCWEATYSLSGVQLNADGKLKLESD